MRTLHLTTLLKEYIYKLNNQLVNSWVEFKQDNKTLRHFATYTECRLFVDRYKLN